jgi:hypothetical protein
MPGSLLTETEAAAHLTVSVAWLRKQRLFARPPAYHKLAGAVRYHVDDLAAFIKASRVEPQVITRRGRLAA